VVSKALALVLALATLVQTPPPAPVPESDSDLAAGIALVEEGDFEGAVVKLDAAVRQLEAEGADAEVARAYLYLGVAYLELDQGALARGKFAQALTRQPAMRLDPREFSAQVIRTFEATRQEMPPAEPARDKKPAAVLLPSGEAAEDRRKRRSALPFILLGGAAAAGGVALASSGGAPTPSPSPSATPTPSPSPSPSATPTPRPSPTPTPAACTYTASPRTQSVPGTGSTGTCRIGTRADCSWTAESTAGWLKVTAGTSGTGSGDVSFRALPNPENDPRTARIQLQGHEDARCIVQQEEGEGALPALVSWASDLAVPGGSGNVVVDGAFAALHGPGRSEAARVLAAGPHRVDAVLTSARGRAGVWRFQLGRAVRPGTLRVLSGDAARVSADAVAFRLRGAAGERVSFAFETGRR